jgi:hypothetical protein
MVQAMAVQEGSCSARRAAHSSSSLWAAPLGRCGQDLGALAEALGRRQAERLGEAERGRNAERRRPHEGEELEQVERGEGVRAEAPGHRRGVA